jgi:GTP-binding protein
MKFIDEVVIRVSSGKGGPGLVSFKRESMNPRGGPDGGDGGRGADLVLVVDPRVNTLVDFRRNKLYKAPDGNPGEPSNRTGANGQDLELLVPPGTLVKNMNNEVIVDMTNLDRFVLCKGGRGGKGNAFFKTSINQAPDRAQPGEPLTELEIKLELKLLADVGIIGFPNAGKSTLISRISAAKPKIADYPFTTLHPNLGVVQAREFQSFVVADIPGLVKGASKGVGLGIQFLKHIERTKLFIHLIDVSGMVQKDPLEAFNDINTELKEYDEINKDKEGFFPLSSRPQLVVLNKIETLREEEQKKIVSDFVKQTGVEPLMISAVTGKNLDVLVKKVSDIVFKERNQ